MSNYRASAESSTFSQLQHYPELTMLVLTALKDFTFSSTPTKTVEAPITGQHQEVDRGREKEQSSEGTGEVATEEEDKEGEGAAAD